MAGILLVAVGLTFGFIAPVAAAPGSTIFFANGVSVTASAASDDAKFDLNTLQDKLTAFMPTTVVPNEALKFKLAFNPSGGLLLDLYESTVQLVVDDAVAFWRVVANFDLMPDAVQQIALTLVRNVDAAAFVSASVLQENLRDYRAELCFGNRVVIVAHSQGNFYANEAFDFFARPTETQSAGIVAVATPASSVADGGPHTTVLLDPVIDALIVAAEELGLPLPLFPNTFGAGHFFVSAYLQGSVSGPQILSQVVSVMTTLTRPAPCASFPAAQNDQYTMSQGTTLTVAAPGVLGNDTIPPGVTPSVEFVNIPAGNFNNLGAGAFSFAPNPTFSGLITFGYVIHTPSSSSNTATVKVQVQPDTRPRIARNDTYSMTRGTTLTVAAPGVLANDSVPSGLTASVEFVTFPTGGITNLGATGGFTYTPPPSFTGTQVFSYIFHTTSGDSNTASVTIVVNP